MDNPDINGGDNAQRVAASELRSYLERVERLQDEKEVIAESIKEVKAEAKAKGYDMPTFNEMLKLRKLDADERSEREDRRHHYGQVLGMFE
jgi:uncharacterized protein (UPF0335 family)